MRFRSELKTAVAQAVREQVPEDQIERVVDELGGEVPEEDREAFLRLVREELASLHEGNFARYHLRPSEFRAWKASRE